MKSSADKSSVSSASKPAHAASTSPFFAPARQSAFFAPSVQMKMEVSKPGDPLEKEADHMAGKVMRMASPVPAPAPPKEEKIQKSPDEKLQKEEKEVVQKAPAPDKEIQKAEDDKLQKASKTDDKIQKQDDNKLQKEDKEVVQKAPAPEMEIQKAADDKLQKSTDDKLQRKEAGGAGAASNVQSAISGKTTGGQPMSSEVRGFMEPRFNADFSNVRIHSDPEAASLNNQLSARAFTHKNHIFFSRDQYQPGTSGGKHLLAHELTHTIQQGHAVQRAPQVSTTATPPPVQRLGMQDALDYFADKAANIPGFTMLTVIIGFNPINQRSTDRSAANILRAMVEMVPGGHMISQALDNHGIFTRVGAWAEQQFATLGDIGSEIVGGLRSFIDSLSWSDIFDLGGVWDRAKSIFTAPISRLISFASSLASEILGFIREAILRPLAALAEGTRGYDLLKALLGQDPITGEAVPRTPDALIGGFMKLIGQEEIWENIKKGNAIQKAWAWFQGTLSGLLGFARSIPQKIIQTLTSLTIMDLVTVVGAFRKIGSAFLGIAGEFGSWALGQVISLLEILFSVVAPGVMPYLKKAQAAFTSILKNPIGFVGNLVRAAKLGFQRFAGNIVNHLKTALIKWLVGPLADAGVYIPKSFSLIEIVKLVLSVLGLTWQNIRSKLVKIIPEPVLAGLEKTAGVLVTLVKDGPAAAWEQIKGELNELKGQLIAQVTQMVSVEIVKAAVMKLVSMINPAGAVVQAIIAIYNTVTFFIEKINQIAAVVGSFINSIAAIASGQVDAAASKVEQTLANTLTVVIAFLAKFAGLGGIPAKLVGIVQKIRKPIDRGLDKIVAWLGKMLKKLGGAIAQAGLPADPNERLRLGLNAAKTAVTRLSGNRIGRAVIVPVLGAIKVRYGFTSLEPEIRNGKWWIRGAINPTGDTDTDKSADSNNAQPVSATELATLVRRVVLEEIVANPAVQQAMQNPVGQTIIAEGGRTALPAAALQSRQNMGQHPVLSGPPFALLSRGAAHPSPPATVQIQIGGGTVEERRARSNSPTGAPLERVMGFPGQGHYSPDVLNEIRSSGLSEQAFSLNMRMLVQTGQMEPGLNDNQRQKIRRVTWLLFGTESARNLANIAHAPMGVSMVESGHSSFSNLLVPQTSGVSGGILPATMGQLPATARSLEHQIAQNNPGLGLVPRQGGRLAENDPRIQRLANREYDFVMQFVRTQLTNNGPTATEADPVIRRIIRQYYLPRSAQLASQLQSASTQ